MRLSAKVLGLFVLLMFPNGYTQEALQSIEIAIGEWKPFVTQYQDGYGEVTEIITVILERMGYRPKYIFMPWGQAEARVRENESDLGPRATFPFRSTDKRRREFLFSAKPIFKARSKFFYNKKKIKPQDISKLPEDLAPYKIGYVGKEGGYQYPEKLDTVLKDKNNLKCESLYQAFARMVDSEDDSVEVVMAASDVGLALLYELFPEKRCDIGVIKETLGARENDSLLLVEYYMLASKRNPSNEEFMRKFDQTCDAMDSTKTETIARIKRRARDRPYPWRPEVVLNAGDSLMSIRGRTYDLNSTKSPLLYDLPRGTRGLLLNWKQDVCMPLSKSSSKAVVRIISGPFRGQILEVDARFVILK